MLITVRLLASYRAYLPAGHDSQAGYPVQVSPSATVADVLVALPIPALEPVTVLVNGRHALHQDALQEGDVLAVFPPAGGGF
jgi:sulfur carrier protein ThiS